MVEDVGKAAPDGGHGFGGGVNRDGAALPEIEGPNIVQAHEMVRVRMREEHGIEPVDPGAQRLRPEVGRGIDQNVTARVADQDGGPQAVVAGIGGAANGAVAADGGHAHAGPRTQHRNLERGRRHSGFRSGRLGGLVGDLDETEPQFREGILQQPLLIEREVALGLF